MKQNTNNPKSKKQFRAANRFGFYGTLSNGLSIINSMLSFLIIKSLRLFCSKFLHCSKNLSQSATIIGLEA